MDYISRAALAAFYRTCDWWHGRSERTQSIICFAVLAGLIAVVGAIDAGTPGGMYY